MFRSSQLLLLLMLIFVACQTTTAQETKTENQKKDAAEKKDEVDPLKRADIKKMLIASGADKLGVQVMDQMIGMQRQQNPSVPKKFWDEFLDEVDAGELIDLTIPAYDKHLSHDEIKQLIKFYESPVGKKLVKVQPMIMQEAMIAGQKWGMELGRKIIERLRSEGYRP